MESRRCQGPRRSGRRTPPGLDRSNGSLSGLAADSLAVLFCPAEMRKTHRQDAKFAKGIGDCGLEIVSWSADFSRRLFETNPPQPENSPPRRQVRQGDRRLWIEDRGRKARSTGEHTRPRVFRSAPPRSGGSAGLAPLPSANENPPGRCGPVSGEGAGNRKCGCVRSSK
jgi:hypothetical protein